MLTILFECRSTTEKNMLKLLTYENMLHICIRYLMYRLNNVIDFHFLYIFTFITPTHANYKNGL